MRHPGGGPELLNKFRWDIVPYTRGNGIEVGRGPHKAYAHFIAVREKGDTTMDGVKPDFEVESFEKLGDFIEGSLDFVFVWCDAPQLPLEKLLKVGGYLIVANKYDLMVQRKVSAEEWENINHSAKPAGKTACVVRYGAIGDAIQAAAICAGLKRDGYHVTLNCHPIGEEMLRHDPNVDAFLIQEQNQVPNHELIDYWKHTAKKFDRFINLCESVEGTLLAFPGRANYRWPKEVRHKYMNVNYLQFMCELAQLPFAPEHHFYPSNAERHRAKELIDSFGRDAYVILWALSGSAIHKMYPHTDVVVAQALADIPKAHVIFVGAEHDAMLEAGWEREKRVHRMCGKLSLRDTMALAQQCHLVVGPETGVLNAVAFETNSKIVMLSHSSEENLTRDWVNTQALASTSTACYPCHRLHDTREFCPSAEDGTALCQSELRPERVSAAVDTAHSQWSAVNSIILPP
jgi:ADP-heptose:LPS heptosyltransferase